MAAAASLSFERPRSVPPPLPVSLRLECQPFSSLTRELVRDLRNRLTNSDSRGDCKDDGVGAGSLMRGLIDDANTHLYGNPDEWWVITVWPQGSQHKGPVAWCLLRPESCACPTLRCAFYTASAWRNRGIGALLVNESLHLARRLGYDRLCASPWNARSRSFFKSAGFETICAGGGGMSALVEYDVPEELPARPPWRCRQPEV